MNVEFIPGLELNRRFYRETVAPILASEFPNLRYSAALIGYGSDVLGYDSVRSTDHEWGPRLLIFLDDADHATLAPAIKNTLAAKLPATFLGYSTNFANPDENGVRWMTPGVAGRIDHHVYLHTVRDFFRAMLDLDSDRPPTFDDWLVMPQQKLLEVTSGEVFHDGLGRLGAMREMLAWYPRDVWLYMIGAQWLRIGQEEHFPSRCAEDGDEIGSRIVTSRLVRDLMRLCFLCERRYAPYMKWFGTAFSRLACARSLSGALNGAVASDSWEERERNLCAAYEAVARMYNALEISPQLDTAPMQFYGRPYRVLGAGRFAKSAIDAIADDSFRRRCNLAGAIGAIDQFADNTNLIGHGDLRSRLKILFRA